MLGRWGRRRCPLVVGSCVGSCVLVQVSHMSFLDLFRLGKVLVYVIGAVASVVVLLVALPGTTGVLGRWRRCR